MLGIRLETLRHLRQQCTLVIHCAADTSFAAHNRCQQVNVAGTGNVLQLCAALGPQARLFHMSSAVVSTEVAGRGRRDSCSSRPREALTSNPKSEIQNPKFNEPAKEREGRAGCPQPAAGGRPQVRRRRDTAPYRSGVPWPDLAAICCCSDSLYVGSYKANLIQEDQPYTGYANDYVLSKHRCEQIVLQSPLNAVILRPSIVLSHGVNGRDFAKSVLWVLPVMRSLGVLPLTGEEPIDAVSVKFVAECAVHMIDRPLPHWIYHLSAGPKASITLKELFLELDSLAPTGEEGWGEGAHFSNIRFEPEIDWARFGSCGSAHYQSAALQISNPQAYRRSDDWPNGIRRCSRLEICATSHYASSLRRLKHWLNYYLPFLASGAVYARDQLDEALGSVLPACPKLSEYCADLLELFTEREVCEEAHNP
jgi:nucleoside-diphosphate-sugar epimerase